MGRLQKETKELSIVKEKCRNAFGPTQRKAKKQKHAASGWFKNHRNASLQGA